MKKVLLLIIFLLALISVNAFTKNTVLFLGDSFNFSNKNISLLDISEENIVVCVNNHKGIVKDDEIFNEVRFDIKDIKENYVDLYLKTDCSNCVCDETCSNNLCFDENMEEHELKEINETNKTEFVCVNDEDCNDDDSSTIDNCINNKCYNLLIQRNEENGTNPIFYITGFLFLLFALILSLLLLKKR